MIAAKMTVGIVTLIVLKRSLFRKFGMELRGINVNKGSDAKSYFLWAPSRSIIEVHSVILICRLIFLGRSSWRFLLCDLSLNGRICA